MKTFNTCVKHTHTDTGNLGCRCTDTREWILFTKGSGNVTYRELLGYFLGVSEIVWERLSQHRHILCVSVYAIYSSIVFDGRKLIQLYRPRKDGYFFVPKEREAEKYTERKNRYIFAWTEKFCITCSWLISNIRLIYSYIWASYKIDLKLIHTWFKRYMC